MPNTYTQIYIHIVFAVQGRQNLIRREIKEEIQKYISGIVGKQRHKMLAINCMPDHTHTFIGMRPDAALSDLVGDIKAYSSSFISGKGLVPGKFNWQEGYGAFSHCRGELGTVIRYIQNQEAHHRVKTFKEEYLEILRIFNVKYDERYLFKWIEPE